ncbi:hypothetical protein LCGC14_1342030 [marine sediment metagenome]|uniref:Uncharacterized protein n=1 Tax=marine sediment metagenome TaxID=412755 RepID=A0A0F9MU88_9ZZZZ
MPKKVYVTNRGGHSYEAAEKFGEIIYITEGTLNRFATNSLYRAFIDGMKDRMTKLITENLKKKVRAGEVKCENCTMKLTEKDIDNEKCGSCGAPLLEALGGHYDSA